MTPSLTFVLSSTMPIPIQWPLLVTATMLMKPLGDAEPSSLSEAAVAVGVSAADLDLSCWRTLGGL